MVFEKYSFLSRKYEKIAVCRYLENIRFTLSV